jgi:hypothetical protein
MCYFKLVNTTKTEYAIYDNNVYNIDEKGVIIEALVNIRVVCS